MAKKSIVTADDFKMFDSRAQRSLAVARALDARVPIPYAVTTKIHTFEDFMDMLTPKRFELLRLSTIGKRSISELAIAAQRHPSAVSRDVAKLVELGLVHMVVERESGHRAKKVVRPIADHIEISAAALSG